MLLIIQIITYFITGTDSKYECRINRGIVAKKYSIPYTFLN